MARESISYQRSAPPPIMADATFVKAPPALHGMLRNAYRQDEVVHVAVVPETTDCASRMACTKDLAVVGMTQIRDQSLRDDAVLWASGSIAHVRACLRLPSVRQVSLRAGPVR